MAAKYCPRWLFNLCASMTAYEFIIGDMPIKAYAKKFSGGLSKHYGEIKHEEIESTAEVMLRFLVEINAENSDELLNAFAYFNLKYHSDGSKRKIKGIFGSAFDAEKEIKFSEADCLKSFKAYVFGLRSGVTYKPASGWDIKDEENIDIVIYIIKKDASISDAL